MTEEREQEEIGLTTLQILQEYEEDGTPVTRETTFEDLGIYHADKMLLTLDLEDEFGIYFTTEEMDEVTTAGQLIDLISTKLEAENGAA